jgi:hypothetical protein
MNNINIMLDWWLTVDRNFVFAKGSWLAMSLLLLAAAVVVTVIGGFRV